MKKKFYFYAGLGLFLASCGGNSTQDLTSIIDYYPVQEEEGKKWGLLSPDGEMLVSEEFKNQPTAVVNGLFTVRNEDGTYTVYEASKQPKEVLEDLVDVGYLMDGLLPVVKKNERITLVNKAGNTVFTLDPVGGKEIINCGSAFHEGLLIAQNEENNFGAYNTKGEVVIDFKYTALIDFNDGVALAVKSKGEDDYKVVVVDTKGNELDEVKIKEGYTPQALTFIDGYIGVKDKEGTCRFINKKGEEIKLPGKVKGIGQWNDKYFVFTSDDGEYGVMTMSQDPEVIIKAKYSSITILGGDKFLAVDNKDYYVLNKKGEKEMELSDDYTAYYPVNNAKFRYIAREKSHYVLLDAEGKPINKMEFNDISANINTSSISSDFFDVSGMVQNLLANVTDKGIGQYYIGEPATALGFKAEDYKHTASFSNEDLDTKGYKYKITFEGRTSELITVSEYNFHTYDYTYVINPEAKVSQLKVTAYSDKDCWPEAKDKVFAGLTAKGFKSEAEGDVGGVFTKGKVMAMVVGSNSVISVTLQELDSESLPYLIRLVKTKEDSSSNYGYPAEEVVVAEPDYDW